MNSYIFHINLYDLAFTGAIFIGLMFALLLWFTKTINQSANRFLALALLTMIVWMVRVLAIDVKLETYLPGWDRMPMQFLLALGPFMYFYVLTITRPQYRLKWRDLLHLSPLLLEQAALALEITESAKTGAATYATHTYQVLNPVLQLLIFVSNISYLYLCNKLIQKFYRQLQPVLMDRSLLEFKWLRCLLAATAVLWLLWLVYGVTNYMVYNNQPGVHIYYPFYIFFVVIIIWTAAAAFLKPQAALVAQAATPTRLQVPAELRAKGTLLKRAMEANLYYQDPELSLGCLAEKLAMHPHELSRVINAVFKKNFNDFINEYRVRDVVAKMKDAAFDNMTMQGIAFEAGFNSKSTFNRIFRQMTGKSAAEFKATLEKDSPSYHLSHHLRTAAVISSHQATHKWPVVKLNRNVMFRNYFKIGWRSLRKNKTFSILNITGLSIGLACSLLIALYVLDELSYDRYNTQADHIYRLDEQIKFGDFNYHGAEVPAIMGPVFARDFKEIQQYTRFKFNPGVVIQKGNENLREDRAIYADSSLFDVFTLEIVAGDKNAALKEPHSLVLTESTAKKYFTSLDIIGKTLLVNGNNYKITGVIKDMPRQSHFNFDLFMPISELENSRSTSWITTNFQTYLLLKPGTNCHNLEKRLNRVMDQYQGPQFKAQLNTSKEDFEKAGNYIKCNLLPLTDIHLHSNMANELGTNGSIRYMYIFSAIAIFILLIACINFMNLSTARSANRAKEVGVRKVLGGLKNNLVTQFLVESFVACFLSFIIAIAIAALLLPFFNGLAGKQINRSMLFSPSILSGILLLLILVSLISGSYPAFFLSSFQPIRVLKGNLSTGFKGSVLRNTLVVFQFTISVVLMIGTLVIYNQLQYIRNKDLGFNKDHVLTLQNTYALNGHTKAFTTGLLQMPGVKNVTSSGFLPVSGNSRSAQGFITVPQFDGKNFTLMQSGSVDERYIPTFQLQLKSGRNFSPQYPTDSNALIINETAAKLFGGADPVNKKLYRIADLSTGKLVAYNIIGVIKDFNFNSLHEQVAPLVLNLQEDNTGMAVLISGQDIPGLLNGIKARWKAIVPAEPFSYAFLDDEFNKQYSVDQQRGTIFLLFSILAILIACLGLFGLVTFAAEQRIKEIGIRKILGATITNIFAMLSKDFVRLILLSVCIASPVAWWAMNNWLQDFAYRTSIGWEVFVSVGAFCLFIALVTISFQVIKAALASPAKSLRSE